MINSSLISAVRPLHWAKNVFVFAPLFLTGRLFDPASLFRSVWAVFIFCMASSAVYLLNDVVDQTEDKKHPIKKLRPIASGELPPLVATISGYLLVLLSIIISAVSFDAFFVIVVFCYLILGIAYSIEIKRIKYVDIICIASGFVLRAYAGEVALLPSPHNSWFLISVFTLAIFIVLSKRHYDANVYGNVKMYSIDFLDPAVMFAALSSIVTYGIFVYGTTIALTWVVFVYGIIRYVKLTYQEEAADPVITILTDIRLVSAGITWVLLSSFLIY